MNRAAMARAFARSEQLVTNLIDDRNRATDSMRSHFPLAALSRPPFGDWHNWLLIFQIRRNYMEIASIHTFPTDNTILKVQAYFHKILLLAIPDDHFANLLAHGLCSLRSRHSWHHPGSQPLVASPNGRAVP